MEDIASEVFGSNVSEDELVLLGHAASAGFFPVDTRDFAHLKNIGLVFINILTGEVGLTPLGRSWLQTQNFLPPAAK